MDTQILQLQAPYEYIYCNGEMGKHIATYIVSEAEKDLEGRLHLETHSFPIVKYWNSPQGVVWNKAELTDCVVMCDDTDKRVDIETFNLVALQRANQVLGESDDYYDPGEHFTQASLLKDKLRNYSIGFKSPNSNKEIKVSTEIGSCREGYFVQSLDPELFDFHFIVKKLEEVIPTLKEERKDWEELFDNVVKFRFIAESSLAIELNIESL